MERKLKIGCGICKKSFTASNDGDLYHKKLCHWIDEHMEFKPEAIEKLRKKVNGWNETKG